MKAKTAIAKSLIILLVLCVLSCREEYVLPVKGANGKVLKHSGSGYVTGLNVIGSKVLFAVELSQSGTYKIQLVYSTISTQNATVSLYVNDLKIGDQLALPKTSDGSDWQIIERTITLQKGINYLTIQRDASDNGLINLDYIQLKK